MPSCPRQVAAYLCKPAKHVHRDTDNISIKDGHGTSARSPASSAPGDGQQQTGRTSPQPQAAYRARSRDGAQRAVKSLSDAGAVALRSVQATQPLATVTQASVSPVRADNVVPDDRWPGMYRVRRPDGSLSDMVNLTRAAECARSAARRQDARRQRFHDLAERAA